MSRISKIASKMSEDQKLKPDEIVRNFMGGESYKLNPIDTLKMIAASSIFGEPSYYRDNVKDADFITEEEIIPDELFVSHKNKSTTQIFTEAIDAALDYDFEATLNLAVKLRNVFFMRLNPQVIMVRAAIHPKRKEWSEQNPGKFNEYQASVMRRADEPATQCAYYIYINNGKKANMPSILKRSIASKLSGLNRYQVNKYKHAEIGMINAVRLTHASSPVIDELMKTGGVVVKSEEQTWEQKRSAGMSWKKILDTTNMGHMALLRNIRNVFTEVADGSFCRAYMDAVKNGVREGKQFPFRYEAAYRTIKDVINVNHKAMILDTLEECIDIAVDNMPKLKGTTVCLSDNSASAWNAITSEYGTTKIANIDNLSSVIAARCSDEGYVVKFGNEYKEFPISKRNGVLMQAHAIDQDGFYDVGGDTEGGIWKWFRDAIRDKKYCDNIFIFSDMQAGTGGLYGTHADICQYRCSYGFRTDFCPNWKYKGKRVNIDRHINVYKLILEYRNKVNSKVNVFSVQTAGYDNIIVPHMTYRCAMLTGWTGKEIPFAQEYIEQWDNIENKNRPVSKTNDDHNQISNKIDNNN